MNAQDKIRELEKRRRDKELRDIRKLGSMPEFKRFIWRVLDAAGHRKNPFTGNSVTFYNSGKLEVALFIEHELDTADPEIIIKAKREAFTVHEQHERAKEEILAGAYHDPLNSKEVIDGD